MRDKIVKFLKNHLDDLVVIYLFGSQSDGTASKNSDYDIAVLCRNKIDPVVCYNLACELAAKINKDVDLVDLQSASTVFRATMLKTSETLFCSDEAKQAEFEIFCLSRYAYLNDERREILAKHYGLE